MVPCAAARASLAILVIAGLGCLSPVRAETPGRVLLVVNDNSALSLKIGEYYAQRRAIPPKNVCHLRTNTSEEIPRDVFDREIAGPVGAFLRKAGLIESIYYIVTTAGVPLKIPGTRQMEGDYASVDSELILLYSDLKSGTPHKLAGPTPNPFFGNRDRPFSHPQFPISSPSIW
jgi:uncharacterized protein (TIGR03790 family)